MDSVNNCPMCKGRGEVGGSRGQTPESFEWVIEPCPDCSPTAGGGEDVWARVSEKARTYARCYPEASDGRNTFILFSEWAEQQAALQSSPAPSGEAVLWQAFIVGGVAMPLVWLDKAKADEWLFEYGEMENLSLGIRPLYAAPVSAPAGDDGLRRAKGEPDWQWFASSDEENYLTGPEDTREAIIEVGKNDYDGDGFYIVEAVRSDPSRLIPSAENFLTQTLEGAADDGEFGEDGDYDLCGAPETQARAISELDAALQSWTAKWKHVLPAPWRFARTRNAEYVPSEEEARQTLAGLGGA